MDAAVPKLKALPLDKHDFEVLSDFRYQIRKFVRFSEEVTHQHGVTPLQYLLLLHVKGYPDRDWATVGELAERLQAHQHGVVALISRCEKLGFVERRRSSEDRRRIEIPRLAALSDSQFGSLSLFRRLVIVQRRLRNHLEVCEIYKIYLQ